MCAMLLSSPLRCFAAIIFTHFISMLVVHQLFFAAPRNEHRQPSGPLWGAIHFVQRVNNGMVAGRLRNTSSRLGFNRTLGTHPVINNVEARENRGVVVAHSVIESSTSKDTLTSKPSNVDTSPLPSDVELNQIANSIYEAMTLEQRVGQLTMIAFPSHSLDSTAKKFLQNTLPGGLFLCPYNVDPHGDFTSMKKFLDSAQRFLINYQPSAEEQKATGFAPFRIPNLPMFVGLDQEGGRPGRDPMAAIHQVTQFPSPMAAGVAGNRTLVYLWGRIIGIQLRQLGISVNMAPLLDVNNNPKNPIINIRAFGSFPEIVAELGVEYIHGLQEGGSLSVGKHFPGHGDTTGDSHKGSPIMPFDRSRLDAIEFPSFRAGIKAGMVPLSGMMTAHIAFPRLLGNRTPATLSPYFLQKVLREEFGFKGLIFTDDVKMKGLGMNVWNGTVAAIKAGADMVLTTQPEDMFRTVLDMVGSLRSAVLSGELSADILRDRVCRVIKHKLLFRVMEWKGPSATENDMDGTSIKYVHSYEMTDQDRRILGMADHVNQQLSAQGLYWVGPNWFMTGLRSNGESEDTASASQPLRRVFIIHRKEFRDAIVPRPLDVFHPSAASFLAQAYDRSTPSITYFYMPDPDAKKLRRIYDHILSNELARANEEPPASSTTGPLSTRPPFLVVLGAGNPFRFAHSASLVSAFLFSFSTTAMSIAQMARVLNGDLIPKTAVSNIVVFPEKA